MSVITDCLEELRAKRQNLDEAIALLERLGIGGAAVKRRGPAAQLAARRPG